MAMGAMLEEAQPMVTAESISHQSYRRLLSRAREYVLGKHVRTGDGAGLV